GAAVGHHLPAPRRGLTQPLREKPAETVLLAEQLADRFPQHPLALSAEDPQRRGIHQLQDTGGVEGHHPGAEARRPALRRKPPPPLPRRDPPGGAAAPAPAP